ncbi:MAG: hypothetical protein EBT59_02105 [Betaproteobacteria bacterium]|nr:hypothetical protein [Betaproteobacteria bacterium]NCX02814.1 hypothetical protein [Betaproteobacteria bacterium]NDE31093.1 hypothetical protein [Betaproteobacteria bacterium]
MFIKKKQARNKNLLEAIKRHLRGLHRSQRDIRPRRWQYCDSFSDSMMHAMRHATRFKRASTKPEHSQRRVSQEVRAALVQGAQSLGGICPRQIAS